MPPPDAPVFPVADHPSRPVDDAIFDSVKEGRKRNQALLSSTMELSARELFEAMTVEPITFANFKGNRAGCWPVRQQQERIPPQTAGRGVVCHDLCAPGQEWLLDLLFNQANQSFLVRKRVVEGADLTEREVFDIGDGVNRATTVVRFFKNQVAIPIPDPNEEGAVQLLPYSAFPEALQREWCKKARMSFKVLCNVSDSHFASIVRKMNIGETGLNLSSLLHVCRNCSLSAPSQVPR